MTTALVIVVITLAVCVLAGQAGLMWLVWSLREERRQLVALATAANPRELASIERAQRRTVIDRSTHHDKAPHDDRLDRRLQPAGLGNEQ